MNALKQAEREWSEEVLAEADRVLQGGGCDPVGALAEGQRIVIARRKARIAERIASYAVSA